MRAPLSISIALHFVSFHYLILGSGSEELLRHEIESTWLVDASFGSLIMHVLDLPTELLVQIIGHLRSWDQYSVAQTCRHLSSIAIPQLWENVALRIYTSRKIEKVSNLPHHRHRRIVLDQIELLANSDVARFIRAIDIEIPDLDHFELGLDLLTFSDIVGRVFKTFENTVRRNEVPRLSSLSINSSLLPRADIGVFSSTLKRLHLTLVDCQLVESGTGDLVALPTLPLATDFSINFVTARDKNYILNRAFPILLGFLCQALSSLPNLVTFALSSSDSQERAFRSRRIFYNQDALLPQHTPRVTKWRTDIEKMGHLVLLALKEIYLRIKPFLFKPVFSVGCLHPGDTPLIVNFHSLLGDFVMRHGGTIEKAKLSCMYEGPDVRRNLAVEMFKSLEKLESIMIDQSEIPSDKILALCESHGDKIRSLTIDNFRFDKNWRSAVQRCVIPFSGLAHLKLEKSTVSQVNIPAEWQDFQEIYFAGYLADFMDIIPVTLETLSIDWIFDGPHESTTLDAQSLVAKNWFERLRRLRSFHLTSDPFQQLVFRRAPSNSTQWATGKKLRIWHVEPAHWGWPPGKYRQCHPMLRKYEELELEGNFEGQDGESWDFAGSMVSNKDFMRRICACDIHSRIC
ncbi:hypothetical protein ABW19_dt0200698 [Dactylella cylindrospora]|nr:hypothetical protein ABW19_dt0200698 [Dactylella cylindrospora]